MLSTLFFFLFLTLWCRCHARYSLEPDVELFDESLKDGASRVYHLSTRPGKSYELKISYPATIPTDFLIEIKGSGKSTRKLLNTEKTQFTANENQVILLLNSKGKF
eukprot:m.19105 g.19105  ORF g.19105 m.19105 type:complete len:106 (+) comp27789_c0_seq1:189-506(+)